MTMRSAHERLQLCRSATSLTYTPLKPKQVKHLCVAIRGKLYVLWGCPKKITRGLLTESERNQPPQGRPVLIIRKASHVTDCRSCADDDVGMSLIYCHKI